MHTKWRRCAATFVLLAARGIYSHNMLIRMYYGIIPVSVVVCMFVDGDSIYWYVLCSRCSGSFFFLLLCRSEESMLIRTCHRTRWCCCCIYFDIFEANLCDATIDDKQKWSSDLPRIVPIFMYANTMPIRHTYRGTLIALHQLLTFRLSPFFFSIRPSIHPSNQCSHSTRMCASVISHHIEHPNPCESLNLHVHNHCTRARPRHSASLLKNNNNKFPTKRICRLGRVPRNEVKRNKW